MTKYLVIKCYIVYYQCKILYDCREMFNFKACEVWRM